VGRGSASTENHAALLTNHEEGLRADEVGNRADSEGIQLKRILRGSRLHTTSQGRKFKRITR